MIFFRFLLGMSLATTIIGKWEKRDKFGGRSVYQRRGVVRDSVKVIKVIFGVKANLLLVCGSRGRHNSLMNSLTRNDWGLNSVREPFWDWSKAREPFAPVRKPERIAENRPAYCKLDTDRIMRVVRRRRQARWPSGGYATMNKVWRKVDPSVFSLLSNPLSLRVHTNVRWPRFSSTMDTMWRCGGAGTTGPWHRIAKVYLEVRVLHIAYISNPEKLVSFLCRQK